jgi:hypothetical protein
MEKVDVAVFALSQAISRVKNIPVPPASHEPAPAAIAVATPAGHAASEPEPDDFVLAPEGEAAEDYSDL